MSRHKRIDTAEETDYVTDEAHLLHEILAELRELNGRLARAEVMGNAVLSGKSAKWLAVFAKASGFGVARERD